MMSPARDPFETGTHLRIGFSLRQNPAAQRDHCVARERELPVFVHRLRLFDAQPLSISARRFSRDWRFINIGRADRIRRDA